MEKANPEQHFEQLFMLVPQFLIDPKGTFKYIQVVCTSSKLNKQVTFVRGRGENFTYHKEIFDKLLSEFTQAGIEVFDEKRDQEGTLWEFKAKYGDDVLTLKCPGGGRMVHDAAQKSL